MGSTSLLLLHLAVVWLYDKNASRRRSRQDSRKERIVRIVREGRASLTGDAKDDAELRATIPRLLLAQLLHVDCLGTGANNFDGTIAGSLLAGKVSSQSDKCFMYTSFYPSIAYSRYCFIHTRCCRKSCLKNGVREGEKHIFLQLAELKRCS
jgi:hypothetical protein